ncbi:MAG: 16S rRNA (cytidine(1402)-2'-O)-methyltransferase [Anaerolineales bacterium]
MPILYLVATPIGNLEDMSPRAQRVLREVRLIAAEDTRHSRKLLDHFDIKTPLTSFYEHNQRAKLDTVLAELNLGNVALISDAGMPGINDPGYLLVIGALDAGHEISPIPGPSAPLAALAASGLPTDHFLYMGYLPLKSNDRKHALETVAELPYTLIFLESPHRLLESLDDLHQVLGDRQISVAAELTKIYERFFRGSLSDALIHFKKEPARGEFTLILEGAKPESTGWDRTRVQRAIETELDEDASPSQLSRRIAAESGWPRSKVYDLVQEIRRKHSETER